MPVGSGAWLGGFVNVKPNEKVFVRIWAYGSTAYQRRTKASAKYRWKAATVEGVAKLGNVSGAMVKFLRPTFWPSEQFVNGYDIRKAA